MCIWLGSDWTTALSDRVEMLGVQVDIHSPSLPLHVIKGAGQPFQKLWVGAQCV